MQISVLNKIRSILGKVVQRIEILIRLAVKYFGFLFFFRLIIGADMFQAVAAENVFSDNTVQMVLAMLATLLPNRCGVFISLLIIVSNVMATSVMGAILVGLGLLLIYVMTASLFPDEAFLVILVPVCIHFHWYLAVPLVCGMFMSAVSAVPVCLGILAYGFFQVIPLFLHLEMDGSLDQIPLMIQEASQNGLNVLLENNSLPFLMTIFTAIIVATVLIRKLHMDYARYIALGVGSIFGLISMTSGGAAGNVDPEGFVIRSVLVIVVLLLLEILKMPLSYQTAQILEFEDDDYVYKVKMIPKMGDSMVETSIKNVKRPSKTAGTPESRKRTDNEAEGSRSKDSLLDSLKKKLTKAEASKKGAVIPAAVPPRTAAETGNAESDSMGNTIVSGTLDLSMAPNDVEEHAEEAREYYETKVRRDGLITGEREADLTSALPEVSESETILAPAFDDEEQGTLVFGASDDKENLAETRVSPIIDDDEPMDLFGEEQK